MVITTFLGICRECT